MVDINPQGLYIDKHSRPVSKKFFFGQQHSVFPAPIPRRFQSVKVSLWING
jgi:hypothetical protein